jgi:hypothetical protein
MLTMRKELVLVLGDSHASVFQQASFQARFDSHEFQVVAVPGATVSGLSNPNSKTQALPTFLNSLRQTTAKTIIFLIGEVDTGFVIWYRSQRDGIEVAESLERAIGNYQSLLEKASAIGRVVCISAPLPTIRDGHPFGEVANARKEVKATQLQRTELTILFNSRMRAFCVERSLAFIDLDPVSLGPDGLVHPMLLNPSPTDHHYNPSLYAELIGTPLKTLLEAK